MRQKNKSIKKNIDHLKTKNKLKFFSKIPKNQKFDLAIISTNSKERLKALKDLLNFNLVKNLILEKGFNYRNFDILEIKNEELNFCNDVESQFSKYHFSKLDSLVFSSPSCQPSLAESLGFESVTLIPDFIFFISSVNLYHK